MLSLDFYLSSMIILTQCVLPAPIDSYPTHQTKPIDFFARLVLANNPTQNKTQLKFQRLRRILLWPFSTAATFAVVLSP